MCGRAMNVLELNGFETKKFFDLLKNWNARNENEVKVEKQQKL
jgi:hypothetical protein